MSVRREQARFDIADVRVSPRSDWSFGGSFGFGGYQTPKLSWLIDWGFRSLSVPAPPQVGLYPLIA